MHGTGATERWQQQTRRRIWGYTRFYIGERRYTSLKFGEAGTGESAVLLFVEIENSKFKLCCVTLQLYYCCCSAGAERQASQVELVLQEIVLLASAAANRVSLLFSGRLAGKQSTSIKKVREQTPKRFVWCELSYTSSMTNNACTDLYCRISGFTSLPMRAR